MKRLFLSAVVVVVVMMMHGWQASADGISPVVSCSPDCSGAADGDKVPNPYNCTEFYYCINGEPANTAASCPEGYEFNAVAGECGPIGSPPCVPMCARGGSGCKVTCHVNFDLVADAYNCSKFHICKPGGTYQDECPAERPYFDGTNCVSEYSCCAFVYCDPFCSGIDFALVPDPKDCTKYYACGMEVGTPGEGQHFSCPSGEYFNIQMAYCVPGVPDPCPTLCPDCVTSMMCPAEGYFPACQTCKPDYFSCSAAGAAGVQLTCPDGFVFNTNPEYPMCVQPDDCPYP